MLQFPDAAGTFFSSPTWQRGQTIPFLQPSTRSLKENQDPEASLYQRPQIFIAEMRQNTKGV